MTHYSLVVGGKHEITENFTLPIEPHVGDVLNLTASDKDPYYLIERIQLSINNDFVALHVKKFENKLAATLSIGGFN